jgi:hypothetical protein
MGVARRLRQMVAGKKMLTKEELEGMSLSMKTLTLLGQTIQAVTSIREVTLEDHMKWVHRINARLDIDLVRDYELDNVTGELKAKPVQGQAQSPTPPPEPVKPEAPKAEPTPPQCGSGVPPKTALPEAKPVEIKKDAVLQGNEATEKKEIPKG